MSLNTLEKILITGLPRTGTTFFGNLLGSCEQVEYFFEPDMITKLMNNIEKIEESIWKDIFEGYCLKELLANAIAGRRLNFNTNDDSCVFNYKSKADIEKRMEKSWRAAELQEQLPNYIFAFKTPGVSNYLKKVMSFYEKWNLVVVFRNYEDVLSSILVKGWFNENNKNKITPFIIIEGLQIPQVISSTWHAQWASLNETERAMVYMNEQLQYLSNLDKYIRVDYDKIVQNPKKVLEYFEQLNIKPTVKTNELLSTIKNNNIDNSHLLKTNISKNILETALQLKSKLFI